MGSVILQAGQFADSQEWLFQAVKRKIRAVPSCKWFDADAQKSPIQAAKHSVKGSPARKYFDSLMLRNRVFMLHAANR